MKNQKRLIALFLAFMVTGVHATTITYEFTTDNVAGLDATVVGIDPNVSATAISDVGFGGSTGFNTTAFWGISNSTPLTDGNYAYVFGTFGGMTSVFELDPANNYLEFTVEAVAGSFNVTGASLDARATSDNNTYSFSLRSSADTYASELFGQTGITGGTWNNYSDTITGVTNQTSTTFRLYLKRDAVSNNDPARLDNISVTVAAIPEPSTFMLMGLAGVAVLMGLRRRR